MYEIISNSNFVFKIFCIQTEIATSFNNNSGISISLIFRQQCLATDFAISRNWQKILEIKMNETVFDAVLINSQKQIGYLKASNLFLNIRRYELGLADYCYNFHWHVLVEAEAFQNV